MTLDTDRLTLRLWRPEDFEAFAAMSAEPEVMKFIAVDGKPAPRFLAWQGFCAVIGHWGASRIRHVCSCRARHRGIRGAGGAVASRGVAWIRSGLDDAQEVLGRGYATEAAQRCIEHVFTDLNQPHLISLIDVGNIASIRVAERVGERLEGTAILPHSQKEVLQYGLSRETWLKKRS